MKTCLLILVFSILTTFVAAYPTPWEDNYDYEEDVKNVTCGGLYKDSFGVVTSPNYPNYYGGDRDCEYMFHAPEGYVVHITFTDFDVDEKENEDNCVFDRVHVHDGPNSTFPAIGKAMCGNKYPESIMSSGRYLTVFFHTGEDSAFGRGFSITYNTVKDTNREKSCRMNVCGGDFENFAGCQIQSPNYPHTYLPNQDCAWVMHAPNPTDHFELHFTVLKIEPSLKCMNNNVTLFDGKNENDTIIQGILCKEMHAPTTKIFKTTGPYLRLDFHTQDETLKERSDRTFDFDHYAGFAAEVRLIKGPTTIPPTITTTTKKVIPTTKSTTTTTSTVTEKETPPTTTTPQTTTTEKQKTAAKTEKSTVEPVKPRTKEPEVEPKPNNTGTDNAPNKKTTANKIPASAMSGLVIGVIVGILIIVLLILIFVAYIHWKRQNYRIRLRTEDDQNGLIGNMDGDMSEVNFRKSSGRIVRSGSQQVAANRDSTLSDSQL